MKLKNLIMPAVAVATISLAFCPNSLAGDGFMSVGGGYTSVSADKSKTDLSGFSVQLWTMLRGTMLSSSTTTEKVTNISLVLPIGALTSDSYSNNSNNPYIMLWGDMLGINVDMTLGYAWRDDPVTKLTKGSFSYGIEPGIVLFPMGVRDGHLLIKAGYVYSATSWDTYRGYIVSADYIF